MMLILPINIDRLNSFNLAGFKKGQNETPNQLWRNLCDKKNSQESDTVRTLEKRITITYQFCLKKIFFTTNFTIDIPFTTTNNFRIFSSIILVKTYC